jgi:hypothetical protein
MIKGQLPFIPTHRIHSSNSFQPNSNLCLNPDIQASPILSLDSKSPPTSIMCQQLPIDRIAVLSMYEVEGVTSMPVSLDIGGF